MNETRRTESVLTGRPLRDTRVAAKRRSAGVVDGLSPERREEAVGRNETRDRETDDHESDIAASHETIRQVTETYGVLLDKLSAYALEVRDLERRLAEEERATGEALRAAARAEQAAREAQAQAADAEAEAEQSAETVRELEHQLGALRTQTAKLMNAVERLYPDLDEAPAGPPRGLRVVR